MRFLTFLILVVSTSLSAGTIHKWVDENGNVHYGDTPPTQAKTESVSVQAPPSNPGKALPRLNQTGAEQSGQNPPAGAAADEEVTQATPDQAADICQTAREDLRVISNSSRIKLRQSDGTTRYMSDEEIEERRAQSQLEVDRYCN